MRPFTWVPLYHAVFSISYNLCNWYLFKNIKCNSVEFQTHQLIPNMKNIQKYKREETVPNSDCPISGTSRSFEPLPLFRTPHLDFAIFHSLLIIGLCIMCLAVRIWKKGKSKQIIKESVQ